MSRYEKNILVRQNCSRISVRIFCGRGKGDRGSQGQFIEMSIVIVNAVASEKG